MKLLKTLFLVMMAASVVLGAEAKDRKKKTEPEVLTIYAFGVAQDLSDSIVYVTNISTINGATMLPHDILKHQQYYSEQMKNYVAETYGVAHPTVGFFYTRTEKKIVKMMARAQEKMTKSAFKTLRYENISINDFHFKVPVLVNADE